jgi:hypothetical protein
MATANDKTALHRSPADAPKHSVPVGTIPDRDTEHFEFDQHVLLSPPPSTVITDPFEDDARGQPARESLDLDSIARHNAAAHALKAHDALQGGQTPPSSEPIATGLQIKTDLPTSVSPLFSGSLESDSYLRHSISTSSIPKRTPSIRAALHSSAGSLSPGSALSSPQLAAMLNITPLPSPIEASRDRVGHPWLMLKHLRSRELRLSHHLRLRLKGKLTTASVLRLVKAMPGFLK